MRKINIICIFILVFTFHASGQQKSPHEFGVALGGGISTLKYKYGEMGLGGNSGITYTYYFNINLGIRTGVEISFLNARISNFSGQGVSQGLTDSDKDEYDLYSTFEGYNESQKAFMLQVPIMLSYESNLFNNKYYISGGVKIGFPIKAQFTSSLESVNSKGWYPSMENWAETQIFAGFGNFSNIVTNSDLSLKPLLVLSLETGIKWNSKRINRPFYTGLFLDYGVNNIVTKSNQPFITHGIDRESYILINNSFLESEIVNGNYLHEGGSVNSIVGKVVPMSIGLKTSFIINKI